MKILRVLTLCLLMSLIGAAGAQAKLMVTSPQGMIQDSDVIIVGTIMTRDYSEQVRKVTIQVESVLKGKMNQDLLKLEQQLGPNYGWLGFNFPEPGKHVVVCLRESEPGRYALSFDLNDVAVIKGKQISMYQGSKINGTAPEAYAAALQKLYQAKYQAGLVQKETTTADQANKEDSSTIVKPFILVMLLVVVIGLVRRLISSRE